MNEYQECVKRSLVRDYLKKIVKGDKSMGMAFVEEYMECLEKITAWCIQRSKQGDVTVEQLAQNFAKNIISSASKKETIN